MHRNLTFALARVDATARARTRVGCEIAICASDNFDRAAQFVGCARSATSDEARDFARFCERDSNGGALAAREFPFLRADNH